MIKEMLSHQEILKLERMSYVLSFETLLNAYKLRLSKATKEMDTEQLCKCIDICERVLKEMKG